MKKTLDHTIKTQIIQTIYAVCESVVEQNNYHLLEIEVDDAGAVPVIRLFVCNDTGYCDLNTCEVISRYLDETLDNLLGFLQDSYELEVSSPGVERQLKTFKEYKIFKGKEVCIQYQQDDQTVTQFKGRILNVIEDSEQVEVQEKTGNILRIPFRRMMTSRLIFKFNLK